MGHLMKSDIADATAEVLVDVDSLMDWVNAECATTFATKWPRVTEATAEDFNHVTVANLASLMFDFGQPAGVTQAARDAIANRYVALPEVQARIHVIAERIAAERVLDEQQDREERRNSFRRLMDYSEAAMPVQA